MCALLMGTCRATATSSFIFGTCDWEHNRISEEQLCCLEKRMGIDLKAPENYVKKSQEIMHPILTALKLDPINAAGTTLFEVETADGDKYQVPPIKVDLITWIRFVTLSMCEDEHGEVLSGSARLNDFFWGGKFIVMAFNLVNPVYSVSKMASVVPMEPNPFKPLVRFLDKPYNKLKDLDEEVADKCGKANSALGKFYFILNKLGYLQWAAMGLDTVARPGIERAICESTNHFVRQQTSEGGHCYETSNYCSDEYQDSSDEQRDFQGPGQRFTEAYEIRTAAFDEIAELVEKAQEVVESLVSSLNGLEIGGEKVKDLMTNAMEWIDENLIERIGKPMVEALSPLESFFLQIGELLNNPVVEAALFLGEGVDDLINAFLEPFMKAFGINDLVELFTREITEKLNLPFDLNMIEEFSVFEKFVEIDVMFDDALNLLNDEIDYIIDIIDVDTSTARGLLDPSIDAANALADSVIEMNNRRRLEGWSDVTNGTNGDHFRMVFSDNGETVKFECDSNFYPIVFDADHSRGPCDESIAHHMRFPCKNFTDNECVFDYSALLRCPPVNLPELTEKIPSITTDAFYGRYLCFESSDGTDRLKDLPFITELRQYNNENEISHNWESHYRFPEQDGTRRTEDVVPLMPNFPMRSNAECNIDQVILFEFSDSPDIPEVLVSGANAQQELDVIDDLLAFIDIEISVENRHSNYSSYDRTQVEDQLQEWLYTDVGFHLGVQCQKSTYELLSTASSAERTPGPGELHRCEGDCNSDSECGSGLRCFQRDESDVPGCEGTPKKDWDYCIDSFILSTGYTSDGKTPGPGELQHCEGDCDNDSECGSGLICLQRNEGDSPVVPGCQGKAIEGWDYCIKSTDAVDVAKFEPEYQFEPKWIFACSLDELVELWFEENCNADSLLNELPLLDGLGPELVQSVGGVNVWNQDPTPYYYKTNYGPNYGPWHDIIRSKEVRSKEEEFQKAKKCADSNTSRRSHRNAREKYVETYLDLRFNFNVSSNELLSTGSSAERTPGPGELQRCEGDCNSDSQCGSGLRCFQRLSGDKSDVPGCEGTPKEGWDYCIRSNELLSTGYTSDGKTPGPGELQHCEGDCDSDSECGSGLICLQRNEGDSPVVPGCQGKIIEGWDYCIKSTDTWAGRKEVCDEYLASCEGQDFCDLSQKCPRERFDYACVWEEDEKQVTHAFTKSSRYSDEGGRKIGHDEDKEHQGQIKIVDAACPEGMNAFVKEAEVGRFIDVEDVKQYALDVCSNHTCTIDASLLVNRRCEDKTREAWDGCTEYDQLPISAKVETSCECEPKSVWSFSEKSCLTCALGEHKDEAADECVPCPTGTYASWLGGLGYGLCNPCPSGTYNNEPGHIWEPLETRLSCPLVCPKGTYSKPGAASSQDCLNPEASYTVISHDWGAPGDSVWVGLWVEECPLGTCNTDGGECLPCGRGHGRVSGEYTCSECPPGTYTSEESVNCKETNPGQFQYYKGQSSFSLCPKDFYCDEHGMIEGKACPEGTYTSGRGATTIEDCSAEAKPLELVDLGDEFETCQDILDYYNLTNAALGDGFCYGNSYLNSELCAYDGGDCCVETCVKPDMNMTSAEKTTLTDLGYDFNLFHCVNGNSEYCYDQDRNASLIDEWMKKMEESETKKIAAQAKSFKNVNKIMEIMECNDENLCGNGMCDPELNNPHNNFDDGDCCPKSCNPDYYPNPAACKTFNNCLVEDALDDTPPKIHIVAATSHGTARRRKLNEEEDTFKCKAEAEEQKVMVSASDNDPAFTQQYEELDAEEKQESACSTTIYRKWKTTDPSNNEAVANYTAIIDRTGLGWDWKNFEEEIEVEYSINSFHPDIVGWPEAEDECGERLELLWEDERLSDTMIKRTWSVNDECIDAESSMQFINHIAMAQSSSPSALPSLAPSESPSFAPSEAPSDLCPLSPQTGAGMFNYVGNNNPRGKEKTKSCDWLGVQNTSKKNKICCWPMATLDLSGTKLCKETDEDGVVLLVKDRCVNECNQDCE